MTRRRWAWPLVVAAGVTTSPVLAEEAALGATADAEAAPEQGAATTDTAHFRPFQLELGVFVGGLVLSPNHNFHEEALAHQEYAPAFIMGERLGLTFSPFGGLEAEGLLGFTRSEDDRGATAAGLRAHAIAQLPLGRVAPFVVVGGGALGALSDSLGNDLDPAFHFGAGVKLGLGESGLLRFDLRDSLTQKNGAELGISTHHVEFSIGLSLPVRLAERCAASGAGGDRDGDGVMDDVDRCVGESGPPPSGCPVRDRDDDGFADDKDTCPDEAGVAPDGCSATDDNPDGDGFLGAADRCPDQAGPGPDGCPAGDVDADGITDGEDRCIDVPETKNGFEDDDGCPDELPEAVKSFDGVLQGIEFDSGMATIRAESNAALDRMVAVLKEYPSLRIRVVGHTDNQGTRERNLALSSQRAESVKKYAVDKGVDADRIETAGRGPDQPLVSNDTEPDRQQNRRIELELLR